ncbi:MAG: dockerin type I domain-containing protein, partial [Eubacterium sp.]
MKKSSKVVSLVLAVLMAVSCLTGLSFATASAAEETTTLYFEVPPADVWAAPSAVYCHIYSVYGDDAVWENLWGLKAEKCTYDAATGIASYDVVTKRGLELVDGADYGVIFMVRDAAGKEYQTGNVTLSSECYGGTIRITGNLTENTEDSSKLDYEAVWTDPALSAKYGPKAAITSTGRIINDYFPVYQPKAQIVSQWLASWAVLNASTITPELVNTILTDNRINVSAEDVYNQYAEDYAETAGIGNIASLETVAALLGVEAEPDTTEAEITEPETEPETTEPVAPIEGPVYGNVDGDEYITIEDATLVQKAAIELVTLDELQTALADVNADGFVNIIDVSLIQKYLVDYNYTTYLVGETYVAPEDVYVVAGTDNVFGATWDGTFTPNQMTLVDGVYVLTLTDVPAVDVAQFQIVKNGSEWHGVPGSGLNYAFTVTAPCDVTITYDPETDTATYTGEFVKEYELVINSITAVGAGYGNWLNGAMWSTTEESNVMTEISDGVYQISYKDVEAMDGAQVKFAANADWADSWGIGEDAYVAGTTADAVYNGYNISINIGEGEDTDTNLYDVTLTLDLSNFVFATKAGGTFSIVVTPAGEPEPTEPEPTEPEPVGDI